MHGEQDQPHDNARLFVCNTFLHVRDENMEAEKAMLRRSASDSSLGSGSKNSDEYPSPLPIVTQNGGRISPVPFQSLGRGQGYNSPDVPSHVVWNNLSSPSLTDPRESGSSNGSVVGGMLELNQQARDKAESNNQEADNSSTFEQDRLPSWSAGASLHEDNACKPCAWHWRTSGCSNAELCEFCHMCPKDTMRFKLNKGRYKKKEKKELAAAAAAEAAKDAQATPVALQPGSVPGSSAAPAAPPAVLQPGLLPGSATGTFRADAKGPPKSRGKKSNDIGMVQAGRLPTKFSM